MLLIWKHTLTCVIHIGDWDRDMQGEASFFWGFFPILLIIYIAEVFVGFCSHRGFPGINMSLSRDCVSFSGHVYSIVVKLNWILLLSMLVYWILTLKKPVKLVDVSYVKRRLAWCSYSEWSWEMYSRILLWFLWLVVWQSPDKYFSQLGKMCNKKSWRGLWRWTINTWPHIWR